MCLQVYTGDASVEDYAGILNGIMYVHQGQDIGAEERYDAYFLVLCTLSILYYAGPLPSVLVSMGITILLI